MQDGAACPVSEVRVDHNASRVTCIYTIATLAIITGLAAELPSLRHIAWAIAIGLLLDYGIRAWTKITSPMQRTGSLTARALGISKKPSDKAPKQFACRVGFFFVVATVALLPFNPAAAEISAFALLGFNVLDGIFDFCVGCWMYSTLIAPRMNRTVS